MEIWRQTIEIRREGRRRAGKCGREETWAKAARNLLLHSVSFWPGARHIPHYPFLPWAAGKASRGSGSELSPCVLTHTDPKGRTPAAWRSSAHLLLLTGADWHRGRLRVCVTWEGKGWRTAQNAEYYHSSKHCLDSDTFALLLSLSNLWSLGGIMRKFRLPVKEV